MATRSAATLVGEIPEGQQVHRREQSLDLRRVPDASDRQKLGPSGPGRIYTGHERARSLLTHHCPSPSRDEPVGPSWPQHCGAFVIEPEGAGSEPLVAHPEAWEQMV